MHHRPKSLVLLLCVAIGAAACGEDGPRGDPLKGGEAPVTKSPGRLPEGHPPIPQGLPEGHPPVDGPGAARPAPMPGKGAAPDERPFSWTTPSGWTETPPTAAAMQWGRIAQFDTGARSPNGAGVVCTVSSAIGGGLQANVDRWADQFRQADGSAVKPKLAETARDGLTVTRVELSGVFVDPMQKLESADGMLLGAIVETADGESIYVKLGGPRELVAAQAASFDAFLASIRKK